MHQLEPKEDALFGQLYYKMESHEAVHSARAKPFIQPVSVGQMAINMEIDTRCPVTLLPDSLWEKLGSSKLQSSTHDSALTLEVSIQFLVSLRRLLPLLGARNPCWSRSWRERARPYLEETGYFRPS